MHASLETAALQPPLQQHVLPHLSLHDLHSLERTCRTLHHTVTAELALWRRLAAAALPCSHPSLSTASLPAVKKALQRSAFAAQRFRQDRPTSTQTHLCSEGWLSPDGNTLALALAVRQHGKWELQISLQKPWMPATQPALALQPSQPPLASFSCPDDMPMSWLSWSSSSKQLSVVIRTARASQHYAFDAVSGKQISPAVSLAAPFYLSCTGQFLFSSQCDQPARIVDLADSCHTIAELPGTRISCLLWHPLRPYLAAARTTAADQQELLVFDAGRACNLLPPTAMGHANPTRWSEDGQMLELCRIDHSGGAMPHPQILDVASGRIVLDLPHICAGSMAPDGFR